MAAILNRALPALVVSCSLFAGPVNGGSLSLQVPKGFATIQEAIDTARSGIDEVVVAPGVYLTREPIRFQGKAITVRAAVGPRVTVIRMPGDAGMREGVVAFDRGEDRDSILEGFTLSGARGDHAFAGAGIYCHHSSPTIKNCIISENRGYRGGGVSSWGGSSPLLIHCTITGNLHFGIYSDDSSPELADCIVWDNPGKALGFGQWRDMVVNHSCLDSESGQSYGTGNITSDPMFRGHRDRAEVYIDAARQEPGDGSPQRPYPVLAQALYFDPAVSASSPCHDPVGGGTMGAEAGLADPPGVIDITVHLKAGAYSMGVANLAHHVSLVGEGRDRTFIEGPVAGLRTGSSLRDVTIARGEPAVVDLSFDEQPEILDCTIRDGEDAGVYCLGASPTLTRCTLTANSHDGLVCVESASPILTECRITAGSTGISCAAYSSPTFLRCEVSGNSDSALRSFLDSSPSFENCLITGNCAAYLMPVLELRDASATFTHSTITGNLGRGVNLAEQGDSRLFLNGSILWDNAGESIRTSELAMVTAKYSCVEGLQVLNGPGNINQDPLFVGWGRGATAYLNESAAPGGDGSSAHPFNDLEEALRFDLALSRRSPCLGSGPEGTNMGADTGVSGSDERTGERRIVIGPGEYSAPRLNLVHHASLEGRGAGVTRVLGPVDGLRTGASLRSMTLAGEGSILIGNQAAPEISDCIITRDGTGVRCEDDASPTLRGCRMVGNQGSGMRLWGASPVLIDCDLDDNRGYGLDCFDRDTVVLTGCSISRNGLSGVEMVSTTINFSNCLISGNGEEGISSRFQGWMVFENSTIAGNLHEGFALGLSRVTLKNSIVWGNAKGMARISADSEFEADHSCLDSPSVWPGSGNLNQDPMFIDPGNGIYRLRSTSPLVDAGDDLPGSIARDLDGVLRPCGLRMDIGAYEACGSYFRRGDLNADGRRDVIDALLLLRALFSGGQVACEKAADSDDTGGLDLNDPVVLLNYLFLHGAALPSPAGSCGPDPTDDALVCEGNSGCP